MNRFLRRATSGAARSGIALLLAATSAEAAKVVVTSCGNDADLRAKLAQLEAGNGGTLTSRAARRRRRLRSPVDRSS